MVAYFKIKRNAGDAEEILRVENVRGANEAAKLLYRLTAAHVAEAVLFSLEDHAPVYTANEVFNETNLLGGVRRYSTGSRTVTIPGDDPASGVAAEMERRARRLDSRRGPGGAR